MTILPAGADVVIIGAGMSGLAAAAEMSRHSNASIIVLEAGPDAGHVHVRQSCSEEEALGLWLSPESDPHFWRPYSTDGPHYLGLSGLRRRVGGRSLYWGGALLPIEDWALDDAWPAPIAADLSDSWRGGPSLYAAVAAEVAAWSARAPVATLGELVIAGNVFRPTPHAVRAAGGRWAAYSPLDTISTGDRSPIVAPQCHVLGVVTQRGRATGVRVRHANQVADIAAAHVVLAGGTVENSRLAIQVLSDVGVLGDYRLAGLVDKIAQGFTLACPVGRVESALRHAAAPGGTYHRHLGSTLRSNHFIRLWMRGDGAIGFDSWLMGEQERSDGSAIFCEPAGDWPWKTHVTATLSARDEMLCAAQQAFLSGFWEEIHALFGVPKSKLAFDPAFGSSNLRERLLSSHADPALCEPVTYAFPLGCEQHEAGTIALGQWLDDTHEFRMVQGLCAVGPSAFPRTGAANPAMTILALSRRLGRILADR